MNLLRERRRGYPEPSERRRWSIVPVPLAALVVTVLALVLGGCRSEQPPSRFIVVGIDGAEWSVIERLWEAGRLPHMRELAQRGVRTHLKTAYGKSPVIWTTIATSQPPEQHGITGFVASTEEGDVPVSSTLRREPALWNMLTQLGRPIAVLGWYASWPAEAVNGLMITDHVMRQALEERVFPADRESEIDARLEEIRLREDDRVYPYRAARVGPPGERDILLEELAPELAVGDYELILVYFRSVDEVSHRYWKFWEPEKFKDLEPLRSFTGDELAEKRDWIPATYERVDRAIGRLVEAAPSANFMVISDHGFRSANYLRVTTDFDALLEHLGYLVRTEDGIDMSRSKAFTFDTVDHHPMKRARLTRRGEVPGGWLEPQEAEEVLERLVADLRRARFESGEPTFEVSRAPRGSSVDVEARLLLKGLSKTIIFDGRPLDDVIQTIEHYSGGHPVEADGIFIAAGPDIDSSSDPSGISIHDITPTLLYGLGLPVAENFSGRAWQGLFAERTRAGRPLETISRYLAGSEGEALASEADEQILDELRALGYLD